jgi:hypothetical protein
MIATTVQINQVQTAPAPLISPEIMVLALDKEIAAQVIAWDTFGQINPTPEQITGIFTNHDILKFVLADGGAILIGADQFSFYWELICSQKRELIDANQPTQEMIVSLAKQQGTVIYETGCKLGFVVQYKSWFYAVGEMLVHGKGFQYSTSRHSSFQLAVDCLVEQSWTEEVA